MIEQGQALAERKKAKMDVTGKMSTATLNRIVAVLIPACAIKVS